MKSRFLARPRTHTSLISLFLVVCVSTLTAGEPKTASVKGKVFRSDTGQPIPEALIILLDEKKSDRQDSSVEAKTDERGEYSIEKVAAGKYTVSIRAWYRTKEEAPCQLLMAKTTDKDSTVIVARDKDGFVQQVFIKGFSIKPSKEIVKDFDFACKSMFEK